LATENKHKSILYDEHSVHKVEMITKHIGMVYSGKQTLQVDISGCELKETYVELSLNSI
jgi:Proteasome subunit.